MKTALRVWPIFIGGLITLDSLEHRAYRLRYVTLLSNRTDKTTISLVHFEDILKSFSGAYPPCLPPWPLRVAQFFDFRCQALTVLSSEPDITVSPSRVNNRQRTGLAWPSNTAWHCSVANDQTRTVLSLEPVIMSPLGDTMIAFIGPKLFQKKYNFSTECILVVLNSLN